MLDVNNEIVKAFRIARDRLQLFGSIPMRLRLLGSQNRLERNYCAPTASEIARLIVGDLRQSCGEMDVIVEHREKGLQHISYLHPFYMSMLYPFLFLYEKGDFTLNIKCVESPIKKACKGRI